MATRKEEGPYASLISSNKAIAIKAIAMKMRFSVNRKTQKIVLTRQEATLSFTLSRFGDSIISENCKY